VNPQEGKLNLDVPIPMSGNDKFYPQVNITKGLIKKKTLLKLDTKTGKSY